MILVVIHYHLRPGGIRRIVELATPHLARRSPHRVTRVVLATGEAADRSWHESFARQLRHVPVTLVVEPSFNYLSEQRGAAGSIAQDVRRALAALFGQAEGGQTVVWAHNLGVGRNLILARELAAACDSRGIPLVSHHHDWWFDNRWSRWPEMRRFGFRALAAPAKAIFPGHGNITHAAINHADATILKRHFGKYSVWLPNLTEPGPPPSEGRVRATSEWLRHQLGRDGAPVWLLPCRTLRRKNIAEALLLARWLRPDAWLVVTGAASSADEIPYFQGLQESAHQHHWRLRLGILAGDESRKPSVPELLAASEAVLLTSIQEGFGLPYLEAAAARRPLIARRLPNMAPDLHRFGFRFPQSYDEIVVTPEAFDWEAERARQKKRYHQWIGTMPQTMHSAVPAPAVLDEEHRRAVPFSRLTLTAQLEVLAHPVRATWEACAPLNPFLAKWRQMAAEGTLRRTPWPRSAKAWLGGEAYANRFFAALAALPGPAEPRDGGPLPKAAKPLPSIAVQDDFIANKLDWRNLYPLLWSKHQ